MAQISTVTVVMHHLICQKQGTTKKIEVGQSDSKIGLL